MDCKVGDFKCDKQYTLARSNSNSSDIGSHNEGKTHTSSF